MKSTKPTFIRKLFFNLFVCTLFLCAFQQGVAQILPKDTKTEAPQDSTKVWPPDSLGRRNPLGTVQGFLKAVSSEDYDNAILYLNLDKSLKKGKKPEKLAKTLQRLIEENGHIYSTSRISKEAAGQQDDNLPPNLDIVGEVTVNDKNLDLLVEQAEDNDGSPIWLFSTETLKSLPVDTVIVQEPTLVEKLSSKFLLENKWADVPIAHWVAIVVLIVVAYLVAGAITRFFVFFIPLVWRRAREESAAGIIQSFVRPIQLYLGVWLFVVGSRYLGISILIRQRLSDVTIIVGLIAVLLLLWQLLEFISKLTERRMRQKGNHAGVSAVLFLRRAAKVALCVLGVLAILDNIGFNVSTWLTALGIGGIALALGTQKTVENLVGSVTIIADHPIRVGDYCKAGGISGTVEQIGMRTTQIRTGDRTVVSIPNGEFSSMKIENFAPRDRFLFHPLLRLRFDTSPEQIRKLLVEIRALLAKNPNVIPTPRVSFIELGAEALTLEIYGYINTMDNDEFLRIQEELLLQLMDVVKASGTSFAFPSQTLYLAKDQEN
ncbi:mechanosensitive ion channel family protein [Pedobacter sp.]|uniref:mechanosensitive ion channel family protein n=1 Tax=Pedobacter sp. TaxID=1411316 RepID=UPI003D7F647E